MPDPRNRPVFAIPALPVLAAPLLLLVSAASAAGQEPPAAPAEPPAPAAQAAPAGETAPAGDTPAASDSEAGMAAKEQAKEVVSGLRKEASALAPLVRSPLGKEFLAATSWLPAVPARTLWHTPDKSQYWSQAALDAMTKPERTKLEGADGKGLERLDLSPQYYYFTRYGSPLAYSRALDVASSGGLKSVTGKRVLDFGYGGAGHLRLLASLGADATGIDVDPLLVALYSAPSDQGEIHASGHAGKLRLLTGKWPGDRLLSAAAGGNFDLIVSKNTLKNGYIHPAEKVDDRLLVHLGVSDEEFVAAVADALAPGGLFLIYNLCPAPAPAGKPYIPWADGRCPFSRKVLEDAGLRVLAYDQNDDGPARAMGHALGWDQGGKVDLDKDLFGLYTLAAKPEPASEEDAPPAPRR